MGRIAPACVLAALLAPATAQVRAPAFLTVVGPDGTPLAGAEVTCVFTPDPVQPGELHVAVATTDARGRARCDLLPGRLHAAWAVGPADAAGARLVSDTLPLVATGRVLELHALDRRTPQRVVVRGHAAWQAVGACGLRWFPDAREGAHHDLPWPAGDAVVLPPSPWVIGCLGLIDARGELLVTTKVEPDARELPEFAEPMALVVRVTDADDRPLADAAIDYRLTRHAGVWSLFRERFTTGISLRAAGRTAADGTLRFHAPTPQAAVAGVSPRGNLTVTASRPGHACCSAGVAEPGEITLVLPAETPATIRLLGGPVTGADVAAVLTTELRTAGGGLLVAPRAALVAAAGGGWSVSGSSGSFQPRVRLPGHVPTAVVTEWTTPALPQATLDVGATTRLEVRVQDTNGDPAACALGVARVGDCSPFQWGAVLPTDVGGRAALHLPPGEWFVYATTGRLHALAIVERTTAPFVLRLEPIPTMRVRVVDGSGAPVAGARVRGHQSTYGGNATHDPHGQWLRVTAEFWWSYLARVRSDDAGVMHVPEFVAKGLGGRVLVHHRGRQCAPFDLVADGDLEVVLKD